MTDYHKNELIYKAGASLSRWCFILKYSIKIVFAALIFIGVMGSQNAFADTPVTLFRSFAGNINITGTAGTLRTRADGNPGDACLVTNSGSMTLSGVPMGSTIVAAYLYWIGSGGDPAGGAAADYNVTFNGTNVAADRTYTASFNPTGTPFYFFSGVKDVTSMVTSNATYTFSNLTVQSADVAGGGTYCTNSVVLSAFALVVVYSNPSETLHVVNLWEGLQTYWGSAITLTPSNFIVPTPAPVTALSGRHLVLTWEGDSGNSGTSGGYNEALTFCAPAPCTGNALTDTYNPTNNQFNSTVDVPTNGPFSGINTSWGVDLDMYDITSYLHAGNASAQAIYSSGADMVILANQTMSIPNVEVADLAITKSHSGNFLVGTNGFYTLNVTNNGPNSTSGTITVTDTLPTGLTYVSATGTGWSCSAAGQTVTCTRSDTLASGASEPAITLNVSVGAAASPSVTNTATVSSGSFDNVSGNNTANDVTTVNTPGSGNKPLYLYDSGTPWKLSRTKPTGLSGTQTLAKGGGSYTWIESPVLQSNVTINASVPVNLYLASNTVANRNVEVRLSCSSATGTYLGSGSVAINNMPITATQYAFTLTTASGTATLPMTCASPNSWQLTVINQTSNALFGTRNVIVYPMSGTNNSYASLPSQNVIDVTGVGFYNAAYSGGSAITSAAQGQTIYIRATVSDPFGSYDITGATIRLTNPSGVLQSPTPAAMTQVYDSNAATKIYEYTYTIPSDAAAGNWTAQIIATEGTEGTVTDYGSNTITVISLASVSILKSADKATVVPGDDITYSVLVTNSGAGTATAVTVSDSLSLYTQWRINSYSGNPFLFTNGSPVSGLTLGTPVYSSNNGSTWTYTPVSGGGGAPAGYDANVTNFRIPMTGTMNANSANFTLNYKVRVK